MQPGVGALEQGAQERFGCVAQPSCTQIRCPDRTASTARSAVETLRRN